MKNAIIIYDTVSGSTKEMGEIIRDELQKNYQVESIRAADVGSIASYDVVVIGSPMRFGGFTSNIKKFIKRHQSELSHKRVVYFFSILYIVKITEEATPQFAPYLDPNLAMKTISKKMATGMDKAHSIGYYDRVIMKCASEIKPMSIAYFKGRLVLNTLPIFTRILMKIIMLFTNKEQEGDFLNPGAVKEWAAKLGDVLN
jgi:menaquinone-dependent protoporphyrinogen IX oxidase